MTKKESKNKKKTAINSDENTKIIPSNSANNKQSKNMFPNDIQGLFERLGLE
ncbi:hypothetical protein ACFQ5N_04065 [Lutibacter holmesii]|uniref:Uncharacterized protein n=1 Tax=Lutibacter holmesii TaxID=1137985 RepID=A0ABW3WNY7_9FLAO